MRSAQCPRQPRLDHQPRRGHLALALRPQGGRASAPVPALPPPGSRAKGHQADPPRVAGLGGRPTEAPTASEAQSAWAPAVGPRPPSCSAAASPLQSPTTPSLTPCPRLRLLHPGMIIMIRIMATIIMMMIIRVRAAMAAAGGGVGGEPGPREPSWALGASPPRRASLAAGAGGVGRPGRGRSPSRAARTSCPPGTTG